MARVMHTPAGRPGPAAAPQRYRDEDPPGHWRGPALELTCCWHGWPRPATAPRADGSRPVWRALLL